MTNHHKLCECLYCRKKRQKPGLALIAKKNSKVIEKRRERRKKPLK